MSTPFAIRNPYGEHIVQEAPGAGTQDDSAFTIVAQVNVLGKPVTQARALDEHAITRKWAQLREEFETQKMIWASMGQIKGARYQNWVSMLKSEIELALTSAETHPSIAVQALEVAVTKSDEASKDHVLLNKSMTDLANAVIQMQRAVDSRKENKTSAMDDGKGLIKAGQSKDGHMYAQTENNTTSCRLGGS